MGEPKYTVYIRVPMPRGNFVDPPQVDWDSEKDEALWQILSGAAQKEIDWNDIAARFDVPVNFLLRQVAWLTERHASQVREQVRKATAAVRGSAAPSPMPATTTTTAEPSSTADRRDSPTARNEAGTTARPDISRGGSGSTLNRDGTGSSARSESKPLAVRPAGETANRRRLSSLPIVPPSPRPSIAQGAERDELKSPGPAESSPDESSGDESSPVQSRIIRRPPRFKETDPSYQADDDEEDEPVFQPFKAASSDNSASDAVSALPTDRRTSVRRGTKHLVGKGIHQSQTSDSSAGSGALAQESAKSGRFKSQVSQQTAERSAAQSPSGKGKVLSREGSDGTPSMGSSFSDLDDASVTQSALEEALASHMHGAGSRFTISQAFRSRYMPNANQ